MNIFLAILASYLLGSISGAYFISKYIFKDDIRKKGSGNPGSTNAFRIYGKKWGLLTFAIDFSKAILVAILAKYVFKFENFEILICIFSCIAGHDFPFYLGFNGGKGVAATIGSMMIFNPVINISALAVWLIVLLISKMVSLASISYLIAMFLLCFLSKKYEIDSMIVIGAISAMGVIRHRSNIKRIIAGEENKIGGRK